MHKSAYSIALATLLTYSASQSALADQTVPTDADTLGISVGLTSGTTATNLEVGKSINDYLGVRAELYLSGKVEKTESINNNSFSLDFAPKTNGVVFDIRPFAGNFHLSAGMYQQDIAFNLTGTAGGSYDLNGTNYTVSSLTGKVAFSKSTAPYVGFGWSNRYNQTGGLGYALEMGIMDIGTPTTTLTGQCTGTCTNFNTDREAEQTNMNTDLKGKAYWPVITFGLNYRF